MLKVYNSLTKQKEYVLPQESPIKLYTCGPTVYKYAHIGNMRAYIFMDTLRRVLKFNGFEINGVMNITDVGHLQSDEDDGEDKMSESARKENKTPLEIADFYTKVFMNDLERLNIELPEHIMKATDYVQEMIEFVKELEKLGYAYEIDDGVYFRTEKFENYGQLSGMTLDDRKAGARIEINDQKIHPADFALWKKATPTDLQVWDSPWGKGCPGWHIECSAMGRKIFGDKIDIHIGGIDHFTIHHENEIAQNDALNGHRTVEKWMHNEFVQADGGKMSKSIGNGYTIDEIIEKGYDPLDYKFFVHGAVYRNKINFTLEGLAAAKVSFENFKKLMLAHQSGTEKVNQDALQKYLNDFTEAINDDLNIPKALGIAWTMLKTLPKSKDVYDLLIKMDEVFGLDLKNLKKEEAQIPAEVKELAEKRWQAKLNRDFSTSDAIRKQLEQQGYLILDKKDEYEIIKN